MHLINNDTLFIGFGTVKQQDINLFTQTNEMFTFSLLNETITMIDLGNIVGDDCMSSCFLNSNKDNIGVERENDTILI